MWDAATGEALSAPFLHQDQKSVSSVKFRADGRAILTAGQDGTVRCWEVPLDDRSVDALITEAQVRAGRRIDQTGGQVPLGDQRVGCRLGTNARRRIGQAKTRAAARSLAQWHRREARRLWAARQGKAAAWHLDRLAQAEPEDLSIAVRLAAAYEMAADWANVERAASRVIVPAQTMSRASFDAAGPGFTSAIPPGPPLIFARPSNANPIRPRSDSDCS